MQTQSDDVIIRRKTVDRSVDEEPGRKKQKKNAAQSSRDDFVKQYERHIKIFGIVIFLGAVLILLALVSYTSRDEVNTEVTFREILGLFRGSEASIAKAEATHNWLSIIGAIISNVLYNYTIGYAILVLPFLMMLWSVSLIRKSTISDKLLIKTIYVLSFGFLFAGIMGTFSKIAWFTNMPREWSGAVGLFLASVISGLLGKIGSLLILLTISVILLIISLNLNINDILNRLSLPSMKDIMSRLKTYFSRKPKEEPEERNSVEIAAKRVKIPDDIDFEEPARIIQSNIKVDINRPGASRDDYMSEFEEQAKEKADTPITGTLKSTVGLKAAQKMQEETSNKDVDLPGELPKEIEDKILNEYEDSSQVIANEEQAKINDYKEDLTEDESLPPAVKKPLVVTVLDNPPEEKVNKINNPLGSDIHDEEIDYKPPTINLLLDDKDVTEIDENELKMNAKILQEKLETFKIYIENLSVTPGPVVTQYEFVPAAGIKISKIESLADDIAMALKARGIRIIAPIPGKGTVGIEIPNMNPSMVRFSSVIKSSKFHNSSFKLPLALGKTISGEVFSTDLARMPHLLIAGSTGSGKSVGINTIITSLLFKMHPRNLKFVIIDPKKVELRQYEALENHFLAISPDIDSSIITDPQDAVIALKAVCAEMDLRYDILSSVGQRNIFDYNKKVREHAFKNAKDYSHKPMPFIVVVIDELADLMLTASKEVETPIIRIAQLARAVGIHLVVATQRPSVDVITGIIKANFPSRIAYLVASKVDSRTILDVMGAEQLLGNGDMLFQSGGSPHPLRIQNSFLSTEEVENICEFIGNQRGYSKPYMLPSLNESGGAKADISKDDRDPLFEEAARTIIRTQQGSVSMLQRRLKIGFARAGRIVDELEAAGVLGPYDGSKARAVLMESESELEAVL